MLGKGRDAGREVRERGLQVGEPGGERRESLVPCGEAVVVQFGGDRQRLGWVLRELEGDAASVW